MRLYSVLVVFLTLTFSSVSFGQLQRPAGKPGNSGFLVWGGTNLFINNGEATPNATTIYEVSVWPSRVVQGGSRTLELQPRLPAPVQSTFDLTATFRTSNNQHRSHQTVNHYEFLQYNTKFAAHKNFELNWQCRAGGRGYTSGSPCNWVEVVKRSDSPDFFNMLRENGDGGIGEYRVFVDGFRLRGTGSGVNSAGIEPRNFSFSVEACNPNRYLSPTQLPSGEYGKDYVGVCWQASYQGGNRDPEFEFALRGNVFTWKKNVSTHVASINGAPLRFSDPTRYNQDAPGVVIRTQGALFENVSESNMDAFYGTVTPDTLTGFSMLGWGVFNPPAQQVRRITGILNTQTADFTTKEVRTEVLQSMNKNRAGDVAVGPTIWGQSFACINTQFCGLTKGTFTVTCGGSSCTESQGFGNAGPARRARIPAERRTSAQR